MKDRWTKAEIARAIMGITLMALGTWKLIELIKTFLWEG
jgi:hypothetical protein